MGIFSESESVHIIKRETNQTDLELADEIDVGERKVRDIKKKPSSKHTKNSEKIQLLLAEKVDLPWSDAAQAQIIKMMVLARSGKFMDLKSGYEFCARASAEYFEAVDPTSIITPNDWGHAIVSYAYGLGMSSGFKSVNDSVSYDWDSVSDKLLEILDGLEGAWATVLRFKVMGNIVVFTWKKTPSQYRNSPQMEAMIEKYQYLEQLVEFNDVVPSDSVAPFNALAIASRLKKRDLYADIYNRLQHADKTYCDISRIEDPEFDEDFDDFKAWHVDVMKEAS